MVLGVLQSGLIENQAPTSENEMFAKNVQHFHRIRLKIPRNGLTGVESHQQKLARQGTPLLKYVDALVVEQDVEG